MCEYLICLISSGVKTTAIEPVIGYDDKQDHFEEKSEHKANGNS